MSKNKNKQHKKSREKKDNLPETFFKQIGIKPLTETAFHRELDKHGLGEIRSYYPCNSDLKLAKIWWGNDFNRICNIAAELQKLIVPLDKHVLDVGGGPGHMAFWLSHIWPTCNLTVADNFSKVGIAWGKEIGTEKVNFIDSQLPELGDVESNKYDVVLISRVLGNIKDFTFPDYINVYDSETYLNSEDGKKIFHKLELMAETIDRILNSTGRVILVDFWSDDRLLLISKAFESKGFSVNLEIYDPKMISKMHSVLIFSKLPDQHQIKDRIVGLAAFVNFSSGPHGFVGISAEAIRKLFNDTKPLMECEYQLYKGNVRMLNEIIEKEGLALFYRTGTNGRRTAWVYPGIMIPEIISNMKTMIKEILSNKEGEILMKRSSKI